MLHSKLQEFIADLHPSTISEERKTVLQKLVDFIQHKIELQQPIRLLFVCTHNSRRSQLAQVWAQAIAYHLHIPGVQSYSGGTMVTAVYPEVLKALDHAGFQVLIQSDTPNSEYTIKYAKDCAPVVLFSKGYAYASNPKEEFAAIMTCDHAAIHCPTVPGAKSRIALTYRDPKVYDENAVCTEMYQQTSRKIATELYYVFSHIKLPK